MSGNPYAPPQVPAHNSVIAARKRAAPVWMLLGHGVALLVLLLLLVGIVPRFDKMFAEFGMNLPAITVLVIHLSRSLIHFGIVLIPLGILVDGGVLLVLSRARHLPSWLRLLWFYGVLFIAGCVLLLTVIGLFLPLITLVEGLS